MDLRDHIVPTLQAGAFTTSLDNLFQCLTILIVKNFFLHHHGNIFFLALFGTGQGKQFDEKVFHEEVFNFLPSNLKGTTPFSFVIKYQLLQQHGAELVQHTSSWASPGDFLKSIHGSALPEALLCNYFLALIASHVTATEVLSPGFFNNSAESSCFLVHQKKDNLESLKMVTRLNYFSCWYHPDLCKKRPVPLQNIHFLSLHSHSKPVNLLMLLT